MEIQALEAAALHMRKNALKMAYKCGGSAHLGGGLSLIEILAVLYGGVMRQGTADDDKFILSKGHGVLGLYAALAEFAIIEEDLLWTFQQNGSDLVAHPVMNAAIGIEASTGSLGQGFPLAVGLALAAKKKNKSYHTYVVCGNGECNEGSIWEAATAAVQFKLDNLTLIIDNNKLQSDGVSEGIMQMNNLAGMLQAIGFHVVTVAGHDITALLESFSSKSFGRPNAVIADTIKGKAISFMENNNEWHHNRLTELRYQEALAELEAYDGN